MSYIFRIPMYRSVLVMRGNSVDIARNMVYPSPNKRVCITFLRPNSQPIFLAKPDSWAIETCNNGVCNPHVHRMVTTVPAWSPPQLLTNGTGVFLPDKTSLPSKKYSKRLPPRIKRMQRQYCSF